TPGFLEGQPVGKGANDDDPDESNSEPREADLEIRAVLTVMSRHSANLLGDPESNGSPGSRPELDKIARPPSKGESSIAPIRLVRSRARDPLWRARESPPRSPCSPRSPDIQRSPPQRMGAPPGLRHTS